MSNAFDKGATELEISLQHQPDDPLTLVGLARCYTGKGQVQKAADLLDAALAKQAGTAGMLTERGKIALLMDQPKEAEPWLRKALALDPSDTGATYQLEVCLTDLGQKHEAEEIAAKRRRAEKDLARIDTIIGRELPVEITPARLHELGTLLVRNGREQNGMIWLHKVLDMDPDYQPTLAFFAEYYEGKGDMQRARQFRERLPSEPMEPASVPGPPESERPVAPRPIHSTSGQPERR